MRLTKTTPLAIGAILLMTWAIPVLGGDLDLIGLALLRQTNPTLQGAGVDVVQAEGTIGGILPSFEVNPAAIGQPVSLFTYISSNGMANTFPNSVGMESSHADAVAAIFFGLTGMAPQINHVNNYEADYFFNQLISNQISISGKVVNQSFVFDNLTIPEQQSVDSAYDNYAAQFNTLFISGAGNGINTGNGGFINAPATCYNGMGVGVSDGPTSIGTTRDNGRSKPDIVAPGFATSFSTPYVAGAATILIQAATRGDGGAGTAAAAGNIQTVKSLLLNGAIKPLDWTNGISTPLDARYGAGILNIFNSHHQLTGGKRSPVETIGVPVGGSHFPGNNPNNISS
ncbi:MAG: S8 family serine peptidase, partial [Limisphaerales bacterium]